jgi:hypothetical protein
MAAQDGNTGSSKLPATMQALVFGGARVIQLATVPVPKASEPYHNGNSA